MINIFELNHSLKDSAALAQSEDGLLFVDRETVIEKIPGLAGKCLEDMQALVDYLDGVFPDDVDYYMVFDGKKPTLDLEYNDGPMAMCGQSLPFETNEEFYECLDSLEWDHVRSASIHNTGVFDQMLDHADGQRVNLTPVATVRKRTKTFSRELQKTCKKSPHAYGCLFLNKLGHYDSKPVSKYYDVEYREFLERFAEDLMHLPLLGAICVEGKLVPNERAEQIRREALATLPPISRALAEGRLPVEPQEREAI
ncbi:hypothetical protein [Ruficoccus sp. ZRK36]|uniref:hypothetical protein n=1 Tax=Ruficoccus sp. ZRK36 TaxID=2866311 RepID=UPI001C72D59D|nr:hypothetical protein [Ruficoccus sp. ZRK36]QYY36464.1 hypothetical protein K0V07_03105 [Ruficoccus sp. ZRK36]